MLEYLGHGGKRGNTRLTLLGAGSASHQQSQASAHDQDPHWIQRRSLHLCSPQPFNTSGSDRRR
jgi:hypothetical protein